MAFSAMRLRPVIFALLVLVISACEGDGGRAATPSTRQGSPGTATLTVTKSGTGSGTVTSIPKGINCGSDCSEDYESGYAASTGTCSVYENVASDCNYFYVSGTGVTLLAISATSSVFSGWSGNCSGTDSEIRVTMNSTGRCMATFTATLPFNKAKGFNNTVLAIAPVGDGSGDIYVGGFFTTYNGPEPNSTTYNATEANSIIRLNSDGTVDTRFAIGTGFNGHVLTLLPTTDGSGDIYVGGLFTSYNGTVANRIIRLNSDGTVDPGFAIGTGFDGDVRTLAQATDGSGDIYVGGFFTTYNGTSANRMIRLNSNGTVDTGFAIGTGFNDTVRTLLPTTDGSGDIYVGGDFRSYNGTMACNLTAGCHIIRLNSDGTVDRGFAIGGGFNNTVLTLAQTADGSGDIYVGGRFYRYNNNGANGIIRLNSNGTVDTGFAIGIGFNGFSDVNTLVPATDGSGDIYVGGDFESYNGTGANRIIRLNSNGTVDTGFAIGTGFTDNLYQNDTVRTLLPTTDGSGDIYVGGDFRSYNGTGFDRIVRLSETGGR